MAGFQPDPNADPNLVNVFDFERVAAERLPAGPLAYFAGAALDERTLRDNRVAFERRRIVPRIMTDVSAVDTSRLLFSAGSGRALSGSARRRCSAWRIPTASWRPPGRPRRAD